MATLPLFRANVSLPRTGGEQELTGRQRARVDDVGRRAENARDVVGDVDAGEQPQLVAEVDRAP